MIRTCRGRMRPRPAPRARAGRRPADGFSLVEAVIALIVLTAGVLGFAGTTALVTRQVTVSDATTQRAAALQWVVETLRATPYPDLAPGSRSLGEFRVTWSVDEEGGSKLVTLVMAGPGREAGQVSDVGAIPADTLEYRILQP